MPKQSTLPEKILSILIENPTVTREEISKRLKVSYQSVQKHLLRMQRDKVVTQAFVVDETKIRNKKFMFWIFVSTKNPNDSRRRSGEKPDEQNDLGNDYQRRLCNEIAASFHKDSELVIGLVFGGIHIVIGGVYDIILRVFCDHPDVVGRYVTRFLRSRPAIVSTSTAWSLTESTEEKV
jgi:DNA-binding Lrp family transcriptional regulator